MNIRGTVVSLSFFSPHPSEDDLFFFQVKMDNNPARDPDEHIHVLGNMKIIVDALHRINNLLRRFSVAREK